MSVDCRGKNPQNPSFSLSWWDWRPLATYCFRVANFVCEHSKHGNAWQTNDGSMTGEEALTLATVLRGEIDTGRTKQYARDYVRRLEAMPDVQCELCHGTGKRSPLDNIQREREILKFIEELPAESNVGDDLKRFMRDDYLRRAMADPTPIECNGCHGYGSVRPPETMYRFSVEVVQDFTAFLQDCGGFEIQ